jgi:hypothetical protein
MVNGTRMEAPPRASALAFGGPSSCQHRDVTAERDLSRLLATMEPVRRPGEWVFVSLPTGQVVRSSATVVEDEGVTHVLARADADEYGFAYDFVAAWITLEVHSALDAVGLTAAVAGALAGAGISCNVLAGAHHDHLLVPVERADEAIDVLRALAADDR